MVTSRDVDYQMRVNVGFNTFATGVLKKHFEIQQMGDAYMRRW